MKMKGVVTLISSKHVKSFVQTGQLLLTLRLLPPPLCINI